MATPDFTFLDPYLPSLSQITLVKVAEGLYNDFDVETLDSILTEIKPGNSARFDESILKSCKAKEKLLLIPAHLRHRVLTVVMNMHHDIYSWKSGFDLQELNLKDSECFFYWRSDGVIDKIKTAQHIVLNASINIKVRFEIACNYCLEKSVLSLWAEMEESEKTEYIQKIGRVTNFWAMWLSTGCRVPWLQALKKFCHFGISFPYRYSFFPLLKPEERRRYLFYLRAARLDDLRLCLYVLNQEEKMYLLNRCLTKLLAMYLDWPLQSFFLEKTRQVLHLLNNIDFTELLKLIIRLYRECPTRKDFDYCYLFGSLWNIAPQHLREYAEKDPLVKEALDACFSKTSQKRKETESSSTNCRKRIRSDGEN